MTSPLIEPEVPRIGVQDIKGRMDKGEKIFFCDVRRHPDASRVKGAVYFDPEKILTSAQVELPVTKDHLIITYCT